MTKPKQILFPIDIDCHTYIVLEPSTLTLTLFSVSSRLAKTYVHGHYSLGV